MANVCENRVGLVGLTDAFTVSQFLFFNFSWDAKKLTMELLMFVGVCHP